MFAANKSDSMAGSCFWLSKLFREGILRIKNCQKVYRAEGVSVDVGKLIIFARKGPSKKWNRGGMYFFENENPAKILSSFLWCAAWQLTNQARW